MIGNWEHLSVSDRTRFMDFADSYLAASADVCERMISQPEERTWANASVALMLAAHSVELFLKGALISKGVTNSWGHTIDKLYDKYTEKFPEEQFQFRCLFVTQFLGYSDAEIEAAKSEKMQQASVIFRYPLNRPGVEWNGLFGFVPEDFYQELRDLSSTYKRLRPVLNGL